MALPQRMCRGCRRRLPKVQLQRWQQQDGVWQPDPSARAGGRGLYVCSPECLEKLKLVKA